MGAEAAPRDAHDLLLVIHHQDGRTMFIMGFTTFIGIWLTLHVADQSAVAAINRALRGWRVRLQYPCYFVTVHHRPSFARSLL